MEIRPCSDVDLALLRSEWATPGGDIHGAHYAIQLLGDATYLVAWSGSTPLGSGMAQWNGCVGPNARSAHPACIEINHVQVRPELRGNGVGSALITAAEELTQSRGYLEVGVGVSLDNPDAARLYRRLGYQATGVLDRCSYIWVDADGGAHDVEEDDELLVKRLPLPG